MRLGARIQRDSFGTDEDLRLYIESRDGPSANRLVRLRIIGAVILAIVFLLTASPQDPMWGRLASIGVVLALIPAIVAVERHVQVVLRDPVHYVLACVAIIIAGGLTPSVWATTSALVVCLTIATVASWPNQAVFWFGLFLLAVNMIVGQAIGATQTIATGVVAITFTALVYSYFGTWLTRRSEVDHGYDHLVRASRIFFWELDTTSGRIVDVLGDSEGLIGWSRDDLLNSALSTYLVDPDAIAFDGLDERGSRFDVVLETWRPDGSTMPLRHQIWRDESGRLTGVASDFTERQESRLLLEEQASHDALTGLLNRRALINHLDAALGTRDDNTGDDNKTGDDKGTDDHRARIALLVFDIRRFGEVNAAFGLSRGDAVLVETARRLQKMHGAEAVARIGATEFAIVMRPGADPEKVSKAMTRQLQDEFQRIEVTDGLDIGLEIAVGATSATSTSTSSGQGAGAELLGEALTALGAAKAANAQPARFGDVENTTSARRLQDAAAFASALDNHEFQLWFQPKVSMSERKLVGVEGLARWCRADDSIALPSEFIDMIELSSHYERFTLQMLEQGLDLAAAVVDLWPEVEVAVNVHPRSFAGPDLVDQVCAMIDARGLPRSCLKLEITEVDRLLDATTGVDEANRLVQAGIGLAVDDFGTGYASLHRLRELPATEMKIDQLFVEHARIRSEDRAIIEASIRLAAMLDIDCVAEGVESIEVAELLQKLGCDRLQGWYFGMAVPAAELKHLLATDTAAEWGLHGLTVLDERSEPTTTTQPRDDAGTRRRRPLT